MHTSAYDRIHSDKGQLIDSAAFDLVPVSIESAGKEIRETPVDELRARHKAKKRNPTGRKIRRGGWLAPLSLGQQVLAHEPQLHRDGLRASDKGFLQLDWKQYLILLRWTAQQAVDGMAGKLPRKLAELLASLGIDASMWRDLVWHCKSNFGKSTCVGSPASMAADAKRSGKRWHRGQRSAASCFVVV